MRRISLPLALLGAVAAAGCSGGAAPGKTGGARGVAEGTFTITVQNGQGQLNDVLKIEGGRVYTDDLTINCGIADDLTPVNVCSASYAADASVVLHAVAVGADASVPPKAYLFLGWAGDCSGLDGACTLTGPADRYVLADFGSERRSHPNWSAAALHGPQFRAYAADPAGHAFDCRECHGQQLQGIGIAPSCSACHGAALVTFVESSIAADPTTVNTPVHANPAFAGLFASVANGPAVTTVCVGCHASQVAEFMQTQHWTWRGATPQLFDVDTAFQGSSSPKNPGTIGKANLINNYCVSVASNDRRCDQCHAGYGNATTNVSARTATYVNDPTRVDCLICHTSRIQGNMQGSPSPTLADGALYNKVAGAFGAAGYAVGPGASVASAAQLQYFAQNLQLPTRENCGYCHFNGGGADSVKIMGTQLRAPAVTTDVHMSPDTAGGGQDMTCADCHSSGHAIKGAGVHTPTNTARLECSGCHGEAPHASTALNGHTASIACQTCHIPAFSRAMPQKTDWDWATAGAKHLGTIYACVTGTAEVPYDNDNCLTAGGAKVKKYDFMKGTFAWGQNVAPAYRWYNGTMTHVTTDDKGAFTIETGLTSALSDRITLSAPLGARGNGKIFPFKVMTGRQAVFVDDANAGSFVVTPNLFHDPADGTDGGFWGVLAAQPPSTTHAYAYLGTVTPDAFGAPDAPLAGNFVLNQTAAFTGTAFGGYTVNPAGDQTVQYSIETLLSKVFTKGATVAGQYSGAQMVKFDGVNPGWDWRYTKMFLDLEHEVAPASQALGAAGCTECHGAAPAIPICELYAGATELPWGVTCP